MLKSAYSGPGKGVEIVLGKRAWTKEADSNNYSKNYDTTGINVILTPLNR